MDFKLTSIKSHKRKQSGFTIVEFLVAMGVGGILLTVMAAVSLWSGKSFAAMANYIDLDYASRNALDQITREIRQSNGLRSYTEDSNMKQLRLVDPSDGQNVDLRYMKANQTLVRVKGGSQEVLLRNCTTLNFTLYTRNTISNSFNEYPYLTTNLPGMCKVIKINWVCARQLLPTELLNSESVQTAKIVIRHTD